jgi:hypothetical protein
MLRGYEPTGNESPDRLISVCEALSDLMTDTPPSGAIRTATSSDAIL